MIVSDSTRFFVNNMSRVDGTPESALYDTLGSMVTKLESPDLDPLLNIGFKFPEPFTVKADVQRLVWENLDRLLNGKPEADHYLSAVVYALQSETRTDQALGWIDKALAAEESFWGHEYKAKLLQRQGKVEEALQHLDKAMELAKGKAPQEYIDGLAKLKGEWKM